MKLTDNEIREIKMAFKIRFRKERDKRDEKYKKQCEDCKHIWLPKPLKSIPKQCPKCRSKKVRKVEICRN